MRRNINERKVVPTHSQMYKAEGSNGTKKRVWPEGDIGREARFLLGEAALTT